MLSTKIEIKKNQDKQGRKRQDRQDKVFYPAYPAACDPAYPDFFYTTHLLLKSFIVFRVFVFKKMAGLI